MTTKTDSTNADTLAHADWCAAERIESNDYPDRGITTRHCVDCGAHEAKDTKGKTLQTPAVTGGLATDRPGSMWDVSMEKAPARGGAF